MIFNEDEPLLLHSELMGGDEAVSISSKLQMSGSYDDLTSIEDFSESAFMDYNLFNVEIARIREKLKTYPFRNRVLVMGLNREKEKVESKLYASLNEMLKEISPDSSLIEDEKFIHTQVDDSEMNITVKEMGKRDKKKKRKKKKPRAIKSVKDESSSYSSSYAPRRSGSSTDEFSISQSYSSYQSSSSYSSPFTTATSESESSSSSKRRNILRPKKRGRKKNETFKKVKTNQQYWIDIQAPTERDMKKIEKFFNLHALTTEDCLDNDSGEKWEIFPNYLFVCVHAVNTLLLKQFRKKRKKKVELNIIIFKDFVLTIHHHPITEIDMILSRIETEFESRNSFQSEKEKSLWRKGGAKTKYNPGRIKRKMKGVKKTKVKSKLKKKKPSYDASFESLLDYVEEKALRKKLKKKKKKLKKKDGQSDDDDADDERMKKKKSDLKKKRESKKFGKEKSKMSIFGRPCWILYAFLDAMTDLFIPLAEELQLETDNLYDLVLDLDVVEAEEINILRGLNNVKLKINVMRKHLTKKKAIVLVMASRIRSFIKKETSIYLRDVEDHIKVCMRKLEAAKESLNQSHSNYMVKLSVEIANSSRATDDFMNKITILGTILTPLALISGVWGMNMPVPGDCRFEYNVVTGLYWFWGIIVCMVFISLISLIFFFPQLIAVTRILNCLDVVQKYVCFWKYLGRRDEDEEDEERKRALRARLLNFKSLSSRKNREFNEFKEEFDL